MGIYADYLVVYWEVLLQAFIYTAILFFNVRREMGSDWEAKIFKIFLVVLMLALVVDGFTHGQYRGALHMPALLVAFLYSLYMFLFSGVLPFLWFVFAEMRLQSSLMRKMPARIISIIPVLIVSFMCFASIKTGWFFSVDENGIYTRGPLWSVQMVSNYMYFLFTTVHAIYKARKEPSPMQRKQYYILSMYIIAPFLGGILQLVIGNHPFVAPATGIAMLFIFLNIQGNMIHNDSLTGLHNRKSAEQYIEELKEHAAEGRSFYLYMMDIDAFKSINDKYGHKEGDDALRIVANVLRKAVDEYGGFAARIGGDEFLAAIETSNIDRAETFEESFKAYMAQEEQVLKLPYNLMLSFGHTVCDSSNISTVDLMDRADKEMYRGRDKKRAELKETSE